MNKTAAFTAIVLAFAGVSGACTSASDAEELIYEDGADKADVVRPYGTFARELPSIEGGLVQLTLNEDRTYEGIQQCGLDACTPDVSGKFRFASSGGKRFVVLYDGDDPWVKFQYKFEDDTLELRDVEYDDWFEMTRVDETDEGLVVTDEDNGQTLAVVEGDDVTVRLSANPTTGYSWKVTETSDAFGYPEEDYEASTGPVGGGGTAVFTWKTIGEESLVGTHTVSFEYRRSWETDGPAEETFWFNVRITEAE
ncbi:MAG TPA: protease inhibitor I42 family protein [Kofleriaceae bacterium]|nr:protease inhibitor I42 family protein [Kofleriaceae bacterium]